MTCINVWRYFFDIEKKIILCNAVFNHKYRSYVFSPGMYGCMTSDEDSGMALEEILIVTGEMEHMNKLLQHYACDKSGLSPQEMLNTVIHPLLDELEDYIRSEVSDPQNVAYLKMVVDRWIQSRLND